MRYLALVLVLFMAVGALGCAATTMQGRPIDEMKVKSLLTTTTSADQVVRSFGKPDRVEKLSSGEQRFIYRYRKEVPHWWTVDEREQQTLTITIRNGWVQGYHWQETATEPLIDRQT